MDKIRFSLLLLLVIALALAACTQSGANDEPVAVPEADAAQALATLTPTAAATATVETAGGDSHSAADEAGAEPTATPAIIDPATPAPAATAAAATAAAEATSPAAEIPGALIGVSMVSQVGVLLDDFPAEMRDRVAEAVLTQPDEVWRDRALRQVRLSRLRLNFRDFVYPGKGQLPLPPVELRQIILDPAGPQRQTIQGHDLVTIAYTLETTILTDAESPGVVEPALTAEGGVWNEPFVFPADPDLLLQRTGNACLNEGGFPPNSYDSENAWHFYDYECTADSGGAAGCHRTRLPNFDCREALEIRVGEVPADMRFERLPWDEALADAVRVGEITALAAPDLQVVGEDLNVNRTVYQYFESDDCALLEGAVGAPGWRRLLQFEATVYNVGGEPLHIGPVEAEDPVNNVFDYNACHAHFHYSNYGDFFLEGLDQFGSKQAFCVQSTSRMSNNELSPLNHSYSCNFQGVQTGWVDEYIAGLDAQWIDITDLPVPEGGRTVELGFISNDDQFLCEGEPVLDENGEQVWEQTEFTTHEGAPINRPMCDFIDDWNQNNEATRPVEVPQTGSFVTEACAEDQVGPLRNCGFGTLELPQPAPFCAVDEPVSLTLQSENPEAPQVVRVCERSAALGVGVACSYTDALANVVVGDEPTEVSFACPSIRDADPGDEDAPQGGYALYVAPVWPDDGAAEIVTP